MVAQAVRLGLSISCGLLTRSRGVHLLESGVRKPWRSSDSAAGGHVAITTVHRAHRRAGVWPICRLTMGVIRLDTSSSSFSFGRALSLPLCGALIGTASSSFAQVFAHRDLFGLRPAFVAPAGCGSSASMFLHGGLWHILFNMLALWMFGAELERLWGTRYFLRFYLLTGVGAGILTVLFSFLPFDAAHEVYRSNVIGASGAVYGLLLAYGLYFPDRPIYMYFVFPIPARHFVILTGSMPSHRFRRRRRHRDATHLGACWWPTSSSRAPSASMAEVKYAF